MNNNPQNPLVTLTLPWPDEKGTHTAEVPVAERDQYLAEVNKFRQAYRKAYVATDLKKLLRDDLHWWKHLLQDLLPVVFEELRFPPPGDPPAPRLKHDHTEAYLDSWLGGREYLISSQNEILAMREVLRQVASMARGMIFPQDSTFPYGQPAQLLACALVFAAWDRWIESRPLKAPDAFLAGEGTTGFVHNNPITHNIFKAILHGGSGAQSQIGGWQPRPDGQPLFHMALPTWRGGYMHTYFEPQPDPRYQVQTAEDLWQVVEQRLGVFAADVAMAVLAQLGDPCYRDKTISPLLTPVLFTTKRLLQYKGINKSGKERHRLEMQVAEAMEILSRLRFDARHLPHPDKRQKQAISFTGDKLFDIVQRFTEQRNVDGTWTVIGTAWSVRAGQWAYYWFNQEGRQWLSKMSRALLELDHRKTRPTAVLAKKIGCLLFAVAGGTHHRNAPVEISIEKLLEKIGELPVLGQRGSHWASRTREALEIGLQKLKEVGILADVQYPHGHGPEDTNRSRGWVARWLAAPVRMMTPEALALQEPPPLVGHRPASLPGPGPQPRSKSKRRKTSKKRLFLPKANAPFNAEPVRQAMAKRHWSQKTLARHLDISPATLSRVLNGQSKPSPALVKRLQAFLKDSERFE